MWIRPSVAACLGLATALSFSLGRSDDDLQLFHKMQDALGGSDKIAAVHDFEFDGTSGWEILPGTQKAVELSGGELAFAQRYVRDFRLNTWLADRDPRYQLTSPARNVVRISDGDLTPPSEEAIAEWETVAGIRFVKRWTVLRSGVRVAEATVLQTTVNGGLKLADLVKPPPAAVTPR